MSIFDELLILIEDQPGLDIGAIELFMPHYTRQSIGSALGRLTSRGWLTRTTTANADQYAITEQGNQYITLTLHAIHRAGQEWSMSWFCVLATLPEAQRRERDMLRHNFNNRGFGRLVDGFWIHAWNRQDEIGQLIRRLAIGSSVLVFETQALGQATTQMVVKKAWDWPELYRQLGTFLGEFSRAADLLDEDAGRIPESSPERRILRHRAKCLVFDYAQLLSGDPNLPWNVVPDSTPYQTAHTIYERIRQYCYH